MKRNEATAVTLTTASFYGVEPGMSVMLSNGQDAPEVFTVDVVPSATEMVLRRTWHDRIATWWLRLTEGWKSLFQFR